MSSLHLRNLLRSDQKQIAPNERLQQSIAARFTESLPAPSSWRLFATIGTSAVLCASFALVVIVRAPQHPTSFLAQARAAYDAMQSQLMEPGSVRHIVTEVKTAAVGTVSFSLTGDGQFTLTPSSELPDVLTTESWTTGDGENYLSGKMGALSILHTRDGDFVPSSAYNSFVGNSGDIGPGNGDMGPRYVMSLPEDAASFVERLDPQDAEVACVDMTMLTPDQKQAKALFQEISSTQQAIEQGSATPDDLLTILEHASGAEDKGIIQDATVGELHVYRVAYQTVGDGIPEGLMSFTDFGFSTDSHLLRLEVSGSVSPEGESISFEIRTLVDEVIPAAQVATDFFSPERLGFVKIPPADANNPDSFPVFFFQNGCYRESATAPTWLSSEEEAAARARIAALGDAAGSMGGGGF